MKPFREFLEGLDKSPQPVQIVVGFFFSAAVYGLFWLIAQALAGSGSGRDAVVVGSIVAILCMGFASLLLFIYGIILCIGGKAGVGLGMMTAPIFLCIITGVHC